MRAFLIFIGCGLLLLIGVFFYAQTKKDETIIVTLADIMGSPKGRVLSSNLIPTPTPSSQSLPIRISINKPSIYLYWPQQITIQTKAGAEVRLVVTYPNGSMNNSGTQTGLANQSGKYIANWVIRSQNLYGNVKVKATATHGSRSGSAEASFKIVRYGQLIQPTPTHIPDMKYEVSPKPTPTPTKPKDKSFPSFH